MARYTVQFFFAGLCRAAGVRALSEKGSAASPQVRRSKRAYRPGEHSQKHARRRTSDYGLQLAGKQ